jgi:hypothetical protein
MVDGADEAQVDIRVPASRGRRLGAACIDWLLIGIPGVPLFWSSWNLLDGTSRPLENPFIDLSPLVTFIDKAAIFAVLALLALAIVQPGFRAWRRHSRREIVADVQNPLENKAWRGHPCSLSCKQKHPRQAPRRCVEIRSEASAEMGTAVLAASAVLTHASSMWAGPTLA